ncbi:MAG: hypothetical protein SNJ82_10965, partial [Gemmataceae bacterium]
MPAQQITARIGEAVKRGGFYWLQPPDDLGTITIQDIAESVSLDDHNVRVQEWANSVCPTPESGSCP